MTHIAKTSALGVLLIALASLAAPRIAARAASPLPPFDSGRLDFTVRLGKGDAAEESSYRTMTFFVLPQASLELEVESSDKAATFGLSGGVELEKRGNRRFAGTAPATPGIYPVIVERAADHVGMRLLFVVLVPSASVQNGKLGGYEIGAYPAPPLKGNPIYIPPTGFVQVTRENADTEVAPHFTLKQFLCKQDGEYPKYLVLTTRLLRKLELLLEKTNAAGIRTDRFAVLSGYRTPTYNAAIHDVLFSRHQWGDAADIYIDNDGDGTMDDLDGDGRSDLGDAMVLYRLVDGMSSKDWYRGFEGGLGNYAKTANHGPFIHVDCRGFRARWSG
ncbi:MAG: peptidase M15A [Acidobacteriota bacterium]